MRVPHPDWLLEILTPKQFDEWMAYSLVEPFGEPWRQTAEICAASLNAMGGKQGGKPFVASEMHFMPQFANDASDDNVVSQELHAAEWRSFADRRAHKGGLGT